jgi:mitochondrial fission protein ELM1
VATSGECSTAWVLSDGRAGHEAQTLGLADALGLAPRLIRIAPRRLIAALAPYGPIDPREAGLFAAPFPDLVLACGRRTIPYLRHVKRASGGVVFTVYVNRPATGRGTADLIVAPRHDRFSGANVLTPLTPPNRLTPQRLAEARAAPDARIAALRGPVAGLLIGGDSRHFRFSERDIAALDRAVNGLLEEGWSVAATVSRRTPARLAERLRQTMRNTADSRGASLLPLAGEGGPTKSGRMRAAAVRGVLEAVRDRWAGSSPHPTPLRGATFSREREKETRAFLWDGEGENPYLSILACADALLVTGDSVNMVSEAAATGAPVHVFAPDVFAPDVFAPGGGSAKLAAFLAGLEAQGAARRWRGRLERWSYAAVNATPDLAQEIACAYRRFRQGDGA